MKRSRNKLVKRHKSEAPHVSFEILGRRLQEGALILLSFAALFLLIALITYNTADPGWSRTALHNQINNAAGPFGAWSSDVFLYLFGYLAYLFPVMIAYASIRLYQRRKEPLMFNRMLWIMRVIGFLLTITAGGGLASLHFEATSHLLPESTGGVLGQVVSTSLMSVCNYLGATIILLSFFLAGVTLATGLSWLYVMDHIGKIAILQLNVLHQQTQKWALRFVLFLRKLYQDFLLRKASQTPSIPQSLTKNNSTKSLNLASRAEPTLEPRKLSNSQSSVMMQTRVYPKANPVKKNTNTTLGGSSNELPSVTLLEEAAEPSQLPIISEARLQETSNMVEARLLEFGIQVKVVAVYPGPVITRFEMELAAGQKVSKITTLNKDLARALSVTRVRVVEVIPGKAVIGLEIPNDEREIVRLREIIESSEYMEATSPLTLALGKDISGQPTVVDLARMPHLLVAGTTGSGKSVGINAMLLSLLYKASSEDVRLILIDPKMLELSIYDGIPHLLTPVVTDMKDAANALRWCVGEMERRYQLMAALGVRNLTGYNQKITDAINVKEPILNPLWQPQLGGEAEPLGRLPHIVVIIDEFADMMMVVGKKVEELIARIAQKARAAGIHMILATQRPSVDVITGLIKANVPTRIAFQVSSRIDSRTILDQQGAEQLLGHGDMLYLPPGTGIPVRIHGAFVSDEEVHRVVAALKAVSAPNFIEEILSSNSSSYLGEGRGEDEDCDELYDEAVKIVTESRRASVSNLQRRLKIGYNRAARLIEEMEAAGVVSAMQSNGNREVLAGPPP